ncbi:hypothetical protein ACFVU3_11245 [Streptomyces sp. NPDC058052]|uniref:hypothetical protein n=1 Tax=Streptomyces sp. NPDC058052 TaxID=3346316 RepID=UPI0036EF4140
MNERARVQEPVDEDTRPCVFCDHPVAIDSLDEWDCPVCGGPEEDRAEVTGPR